MDSEPSWEDLAQFHANHARHWKALAMSYQQQLLAMKNNVPESDRHKRILYKDRTGDAAAINADRKRKK